MQAFSLYYQTEESREGVRAFIEKRKPDFRRRLGSKWVSVSIAVCVAKHLRANC